jgi:hypothetical protein
MSDEAPGARGMSDEEARDFAHSFRSFLEWIHAEPAERQHPIAALLIEHMREGSARSVISSTLPTFDHVNLQVALNAWLSIASRRHSVHGLALPPHYAGVSLQQLLHGHGLPPLQLAAPDLVDLPSGPDRTLGCYRLALILVTDDRGAYVVFVRGPSMHEQELVVEVAGLATEDAQAVMRELAELRDRLNVYRGQLLELRQGQGGVQLAFASLPATERDDVVLPEAVLRRIERHSLDIAGRREQLRAAGRHLKRGLLLYGPPGTGKTHTTRYVVQHLPNTTVLLLSGRTLHMIGAVTDLARQLQPSAVVLEDVDLVAEDRGFGPGSSPVLFELLDAMDGAAADADLLFLLTTNRADLLEPALAARPGRVDVAVEIGLPDADARRRLLEVHGRGLQLDLSADDVTAVVERTAGVTASFLKELLRRAVLEALDAGTESPDESVVVTGENVTAALDDLLDSSQGVTRALLGVPADQSDVPLSPPVRHGFGMRGSHLHGPGMVSDGYVTFRSGD